ATFGPNQGGTGFGLEVWGAKGKLSMARGLVAASRDYAVLAQDGAALDLADVVVTGTLARAKDGFDGVGLHVRKGATGTLARVLVEHSAGLGVIVYDHPAAGPTLAAADLS